MTFEADLVRLGEASASAKLFAGGMLDNNVSLASSTGTNGSSSGSSAGAYVINKDVTFVSTATSATAGNACILPNSKGSGYVTIFNNTAYTIWVFAPVNGYINNYAATGMVQNTGSTFAGSFQIGSNKSATFMTADGMTWLGQHAG